MNGKFLYKENILTLTLVFGTVKRSLLSQHHTLYTYTFPFLVIRRTHTSPATKFIVSRLLYRKGISSHKIEKMTC